jgi:hypothetical protein
MGQILHGSATTTHAIRAAIQRSKAAKRYGLEHAGGCEAVQCHLKEW